MCTNFGFMLWSCVLIAQPLRHYRFANSGGSAFGIAETTDFARRPSLEVP